ncbi:MAG: Ycf48-like protein precursor [Planctomycetaceae bacterium]|nr:Ycf48-like protein precursor [Planctomycetaceae bacterium]
MIRHGWLIVCVLLGFVGSYARAADDFSDRKRSAATPWQDDAALHDVQFVKTQTGWAVGDHGVIWKTVDGGTNWDLQRSGVKCSLRSVCFLTDRVGWIAGGESVPYAHQGLGVLLSTTDGGTTWQAIGGPDLPELQRVKFFTLTHGVIVGEPNARCSSGVMLTSNGGKTWQPAAGENLGSWRAADFLSPDQGALAGLRGQHALYGNGRLGKTKLGNLGLRGLYGLKLLPGGEGWLVGDGGLILHQDRGSIVWQSPAASPPREIRDLFDFRAVAVRGKKVWIAGDPGTVVWHSPDAGETWERHSTGQTLPIAALHFPNDDCGWAVGALGMILQSTDGGVTWLTVRGDNRRVAYLTAHSQLDHVSIPMVTAVSGEAGFRGLISVLPRHDIGSEREQTREIDLKLSEAVMLAGGSAATVGWRLPLDIPGLENNPEQLLAEWTKRSEGALQGQLVAQFVRQLRTWRPSVVILDESNPRDAVGRLIRETMLKAIPQAADPTSQLAQQELADLPMWQVERVFVRLPAGSQGQVNIESFDMLHRQGCAVQMAAAPALARLRREAIATNGRESFKAISLTGKNADYAGKDFFAKLGISPGTDARRALPPMEDGELEKKLKLAAVQRNFHAYVQRFITDTRHAQQLLAQLGGVTAGMPDDQSALLLAQLADAYRRQGYWDLAEATLVEMVDRYPHEPAAQDAMRWLIQLWVGTELTYRRLQDTNVERKKMSVETAELVQRLKNVGQRLPTGEGTVSQEIQQLKGENTELQVQQAPFKVDIGPGRDLRSERANLWQDKARRMASLLQRTSPAWYQSPEIQFPLGALYRQRQLGTEAAECYHFSMRGGDKTPWQKTAMTELWIDQMVGVPPKSIYNLRVAAKPPVLDGMLSDECWRQAEEMGLATDQANGPLQEKAFVLMCHDRDFLYFAGVCPRVPGAPKAVPDHKGRTYDPDLGDHDRITLMLDVDRDYVTYYRFTIDQRGWTNEDLWGDVSWNPKYYVAAEGDEATWRFEVAIPWKELVPTPPTPDTMWAASVVRTVPAQGVQSWTTPVTSRPRLETGGLLKIE